MFCRPMRPWVICPWAHLRAGRWPDGQQEKCRFSADTWNLWAGLSFIDSARRFKVSLPKLPALGLN